jgi:hypothetical protein
LLGDELTMAYSQLASERRAEGMARDIRLILDTEGTADMITVPTQILADRASAENSERATHQHRLDRVLTRVEDRGKGRIAQRWAHHIEDVDLREWLGVLLGCLGQQVDSDITDRRREVDADLIASSGSARAYLRALDRVSRAVRDSALLPPTAS